MHFISGSADLVDVSLPEPVYVLRLYEILFPGSFLVTCIRKCKIVFPHDPPDCLNVRMNAGVYNFEKGKEYRSLYRKKT